MAKNYNPDLNIFMMCSEVNRDAFTEMPDGFSLRHIREDELDFWKRMPFDGKETTDHMAYMDEFYDRIYAPSGGLFFKKCLFAVNAADEPVGTCFAWRMYGKFTTLHWFKVLSSYENRGIGRAVLSEVMRKLSSEDYPVYLHTQVGSFRAIKLYSDFGFDILQDEVVGRRCNDINECLSILKHLMPLSEFGKLRFRKADSDFLESVEGHDTNDF